MIKFQAFKLPTALMIAYFERFNSPVMSPMDKEPHIGFKIFLLFIVMSLMITVITWGKF